MICNLVGFVLGGMIALTLVGLLAAAWHLAVWLLP